MKHMKNLTKYKIRQKYSILQFMSAIGLAALVVTIVIAYYHW